MVFVIQKESQKNNSSLTGNIGINLFFKKKAQPKARREAAGGHDAFFWCGWVDVAGSTG